MLTNLIKELSKSADALPITFYNLKTIKISSKNFRSVKYKKNSVQKTLLHPINKFYKPISRILINGK